jgi:SsrA-binding protein
MVTNKKVKYEYTFIETHTVGIKLMGSEVKSIDEGKVSLIDAYCYFNDGELFVKGMNIPESRVAFTHEPLRERKLLMKKKELRKLEKQLINGLTIVPYKMFRNDKGIIKMTIILGKGNVTWTEVYSIKKGTRKSLLFCSGLLYLTTELFSVFLSVRPYSFNTNL